MAINGMIAIAQSPPLALEHAMAMYIPGIPGTPMIIQGEPTGPLTSNTCNSDPLPASVAYGKFMIPPDFDCYKGGITIVGDLADLYKTQSLV